MSSFFVGEKMSKRIETEKKYYCKNKTKLIILVKFLGFKLLNENKEVDEYFNVKGDLKEVNSQLFIILNNYKIKEIKNG